MKNKINNIIQILLASLFIYCILTIIRSFSLLFLAYTDEYFYNFDFNTTLYIQKSIVFNNAYYFCPYIMGLLITFFLKKALKLNLMFFIFSLVIGFALFRLIDSFMIRPLFSFFDNPRANIFAHLLTFLILVLIFTRVLIKKNRNLV